MDRRDAVPTKTNLYTIPQITPHGQTKNWPSRMRPCWNFPH